MIIACVLTGDKYSPEDVYKLHYMIRKNVSVTHTFVCITDRDDVDGVQTIQLPHDNDIDGWWNKLYLFKERTFSADEPIVYFDLDVVIQQPLNRFVLTTNYDKLSVINPLWKGNGERTSTKGILAKESRCNSSIISFTAGRHQHIWNLFESDKNRFMSIYHGIDRFMTCEGIQFDYIDNLKVYSRMYGKDYDSKRTSRYCFYPEYDVCLLNGMKDISFDVNYNMLFNTLYPSYQP
jgi:hypothetical protein